jgi:hypothetical protein
MRTESNVVLVILITGMNDMANEGKEVKLYQEIREKGKRGAMLRFHHVH